MFLNKLRWRIINFALVFRASNGRLPAPDGRSFKPSISNGPASPMTSKFQTCNKMVLHLHNSFIILKPQRRMHNPKPASGGNQHSLLYLLKSWNREFHSICSFSRSKSLAYLHISSRTLIFLRSSEKKRKKTI